LFTRAEFLSLFRTGVRIPDLKLSGDLLLVNISLNTFVRAGTKAIKKLNPNKSSDEFGLAAEHLKYGVEVICPALTKVFNEILLLEEIVLL
jgi:hypothetical protein